MNKKEKEAYNAGAELAERLLEMRKIDSSYDVRRELVEESRERRGSGTFEYFMKGLNEKLEKKNA